MTIRSSVALAALSLLTAACGDRADDARGVDHGETLLSVSASGHAESRPDRARFEAGVQTFAGSAREASAANSRKIAEIAEALRKAGVPDKDMQTRTVNVARVEYGDRRGQYQASNVVTVTMREVDKASEAVTAATEAGANVVGGVDLSMTDPEETANLAYADAYKAARKRAEAYAAAADMEVARVLYIRDAGGQQGSTYFRAADATAVMAKQAAAAPPVVAPPPPAIQSSRPDLMVGTTNSNVFIQVDFALRPK